MMENKSLLTALGGIITGSLIAGALNLAKLDRAEHKALINTGYLLSTQKISQPQLFEEGFADTRKLERAYFRTEPTSAFQLVYDNKTYTVGISADSIYFKIHN